MNYKSGKHLLRPVTIALGFLACTLAAYPSDLFAPEKADPAAADMDKVLLARIPAKMQMYVDEGTAAGFVTIVVRHGHVASLDAVGYQDREAKIPMRVDTIFRIASMTKSLTVAGVRNPGPEFATHWPMGASVHRTSPRTWIPTGITWRTTTKTHSCSIAAQPSLCLAKTACASTSGHRRLTARISARLWSTCMEEVSPAAATTIFSPIRAKVWRAITTSWS
jgi:Beta-lactamase